MLNCLRFGDFFFICVFPCFSIIYCLVSGFFFLNTLLVLTSCFLPLLDTEDASETDLAKHEEEDFVEMKEQ